MNRPATLALLSAALAATTAFSVDLAVPPPAETVQFVPGELLPVPDPSPLGKSKIVWALPYTLVNETGRDRDLVVEFVMFTDVTRMAPVPKGPDSGYVEKDITAPRLRSVPVRVTARENPFVRERLATALRAEFLPQSQMLGRIRAGERKSGVALFEEVPLNARRMRICVLGLSKTRRVEIRQEGRLSSGHYKSLLSAGVPVVRFARLPDSGSFDLVSLAEEISLSVFQQERKGDAYQLRDHCFRFSDPILNLPAGSAVQERWIQSLDFRRTGETLKSGGEFIELADQSWAIGLSEYPGIGN